MSSLLKKNVDNFAYIIQYTREVCIIMNASDSNDSLLEVDLDERLARVRSHVNSKLENQKNLALVLSAVEENISEQNNEKTPTTYFVSFLALLDQSVQADEIINMTMATAAAYFLDLVFPYTPKALLQAKFGDILAKLAPSLTHQSSEAPLVKPVIGALETLLLAQDYQQWSSGGHIPPKRAMIGLLEFAFDPRPKVRKRAQEAIKKILSNPPASPSPIHVAAPLCSDLSLNKLAMLLDDRKKEHKRKADQHQNAPLVHALQVISSITSTGSWPTSQLEPLCDALLEISKTTDQFVISSAFGAFDGLLSSSSTEVDADRLMKMLNVLVDLKPSINDTHLTAPWLTIIVKSIQSISKSFPELSLNQTKEIMAQIAPFLKSESKDIYSSASQCLIAIITDGFPDKYLLRPSTDNGVTREIYEKVEDVIVFVSELVEKELLSVTYQHATRYILEFITAAVSKFRKRGNPELLGILEIVGEWRSNESESFPYNKEAEEIIAASITSMGPEVVLGVLPLNFAGDGPGRAWLLPLLRDHTFFAELDFFKKEVLPLAELFDSKIKSSNNKNSMNVKIFQTIYDQIWSLLPSFCSLPKDLRTAFDDTFASRLCDMMYSIVEIRPLVCRSLRLLVESNLAVSETPESMDALILEDFGVEAAKKNLEYLRSRASNILSALFNVFSSTAPEFRGPILETIDSYLRIASESDLENTFNKVCGLLKKSMDDEDLNNPQKPQPRKPETSLSLTMLDLIIVMAKYVPPKSHNALFSVFSSTISLEKNGLVQKRSYKILNKLSENNLGLNSIRNYMDEIQSVIVATIESTQVSAKAARLFTVKVIIENLASDKLHFIPSLLQEIIMSTKDVNEKSRTLAFQILVKMGVIMNEGGVIDNLKVDGFGEQVGTTEASLTEYMTMVSAGLASQSPHMISATITAIASLVYEFRNVLPQPVLFEISSTVELFLNHNAREIARAAVGFVKVEILSLPAEYIRSNLAELLSKLMRWSHEHKEHFKSKVKHILERLVRMFGIDAVLEAIPEEDKKIVLNIKKLKNRSKRLKERAREAPQDEAHEQKFVSGYEEVMQDSEDSESDSDNEGGDKNDKSSFYLVEGKEEPLNLLDRQSVAHISSINPKRAHKKQSPNDLRTSKNGKLVLGDDESPLPENGTGIDAYLDAVKQAPIKGQKNKLKYKQKRGQEEEDWSDSEDVSSKKPVRQGKSNSKIMKPKRKQNFKAKKKL